MVLGAGQLDGGGWKHRMAPLHFPCLPTESGVASGFVKSRPGWLPCSAFSASPQLHPGSQAALPCLTLPIPVSSLQTVAVSTVSVTTVRAAGGCASTAHVPQASAAASVMSPRETVGPRNRPRTATHTPAALARGASPGERSHFLSALSVAGLVGSSSLWPLPEAHWRPFVHLPQVCLS